MQDVFDVALLQEILDEAWHDELRRSGLTRPDLLHYLDVVGRFLFQLQYHRDVFVERLGEDGLQEVTTWAERCFAMLGEAVGRTEA